MYSAGKKEKKDDKPAEKKDDKPAEKKDDKKEGEGAEKGEKKEGEKGEKKDGDKKDGEKKEDPPIEGQDPDTKKCVGKPSCAGEGIAGTLSAPGNGLSSMKKVLDDKVKGAGKAMLTVATNPAQCAANVAGAVPAIVGSVFDAVAGGIDKIGNSFNNLGAKAEAKGFDGIFAPFEIGHSMFMQKLQNVASSIALGSDFWQKHPELPQGDPKAAAKIVVDTAMKRSGIYKLALEDAETRGIFKKWLSQYTDSLLNALKVAQPEIDRINNEIRTIIEGAGSNVGDAAGTAIANALTTALSALPVIGGVVSGVTALDNLGKKIVGICEPPLVKGAGIVLPVVNAFNKQKSRLNCEVTKLTNTIKKPIERLEAKLTPQSGGAGMRSKKNIKKKIVTTQKRVTYLLNRFTRRNHKTNYTRRLRQSRV